MAMGTKRSPISLYLQRGTAARGFSSARAVRHQQRDRSGHVAESTQRDQSAAGDLPALRPDRDINPQVGEDAQPERLTGNLRARDGVDMSDGKREPDVLLAGKDRPRLLACLLRPEINRLIGDDLQADEVCWQGRSRGERGRCRW